MIKLLKLELLKNNFKPYILSAMGIFVFIVLMGILLLFIPLLDPNNPSSQLFTQPSMIISMISILSMSGFSIVLAVLYSKFIVEEYTKKQSLLFAYPQKRSHILIAKFILICVFITTCMATTNMASIFIVSMIGTISGLAPTIFNFTVFSTTTLFTVMTNLIGIIALRVGFSKKSIIWTIVTTIILVSPIGNSVVLLKDNLTVVLIPITAILMVICLIFLRGLIEKVDKMECL